VINNGNHQVQTKADHGEYWILQEEWYLWRLASWVGVSDTRQEWGVDSQELSINIKGFLSHNRSPYFSWQMTPWQKGWWNSFCYWGYGWSRIWSVFKRGNGRDRVKINQRNVLLWRSERDIGDICVSLDTRSLSLVSEICPGHSIAHCFLFFKAAVKKIRCKLSRWELESKSLIFYLNASKIHQTRKRFILSSLSFNNQPAKSWIFGKSFALFGFNQKWISPSLFWDSGNKINVQDKIGRRILEYHSR
jgi:hypothetical protein